MTSAFYQSCLAMSDASLLEALKVNPEILGVIYKKHKDYCIKFMRSKMSIQDDDLVADIYQDAVIVLYENVNKGFNLTNGAKIQTYLNSICYFQLLNQVKKSQNIISYDSQPLFENEDENNKLEPGIKDWLPQGDSDINSERVKAIEQGLNIMKTDKGNCYELLSMFYYQRQTMQKIAEYFEYANDQIAQNKAYRCREKLKTITFEIMKKLR